MLSDTTFYCSLLGQTNVLYFKVQTTDLAGTQYCAIGMKHMRQRYRMVSKP